MLALTDTTTTTPSLQRLSGTSQAMGQTSFLSPSCRLAYSVTLAVLSVVHILIFFFFFFFPSSLSLLDKLINVVVISCCNVFCWSVH